MWLRVFFPNISSFTLNMDTDNKWAKYEFCKRVKTENIVCDIHRRARCGVSSLQITLKWRHNGRDGISNHQHHGCLLKRLFRRGSKKTSKFCVTGLCAVNSPVTGEFPAPMASNAENVSIWWRHHEDRQSQICNHSFHNYVLIQRSRTFVP